MENFIFGRVSGWETAKSKEYSKQTIYAKKREHSIRKSYNSSLSSSNDCKIYTYPNFDGKCNNNRL